MKFRRLDKRYQASSIGDTSNDTPLQIGHAHTWNGFYDGLLDVRDLRPRSHPGGDQQRYGAGRPARSARSSACPHQVAGRRDPVSHDDVVVAACTVKEAGAKGDGKTDDTAAFQSAMGSVARAGGGHRFRSRRSVCHSGQPANPHGCTLRGDGRSPARGAAAWLDPHGVRRTRRTRSGARSSPCASARA